MRERKKYTVHGKIDYWFDNSQTKRNHNRSPKLSFLTQSAKHTSQYNMKELFFFCCSVLFWTRNGMYIFAWIWSLGKQLPLHATMHACSPRCCYPCMGKSIGSTTAELKRTTTVSIVEVQYLLRKEVLRRLLWLLACARDCCRILYDTWCRRVLQVDSNTTFFLEFKGPRLITTIATLLVMNNLLGGAAQVSFICNFPIPIRLVLARSQVQCASGMRADAAISHALDHIDTVWQAYPTIQNFRSCMPYGTITNESDTRGYRGWCTCPRVRATPTI